MIDAINAGDRLMTATDELRHMLDERGVEHFDGTESTLWGYEPTGERTGAYRFSADETSGGRMVVRIFNATPEQAVAATLGPQVTGETSDGYHTFNELYHHRAVLFSVVVAAFRDRAWKSKAHHDGTMYEGMFIVGIETPSGQATYHYDIDPYWDMFDCKEREYAPEWDGHTPDQAIERIGKLAATLGNGECELEPLPAIVVTMNMLNEIGWCKCSECGHATPDGSNYCPNCGKKVVDE